MKTASFEYGKEIHPFRMKTGESLEVLAVKLGTNRNDLSKFERGKKETPYHVHVKLEQLQHEYDFETRKFSHQKSNFDALLETTSRLMSRLSYHELQLVSNMVKTTLESSIRDEMKRLDRQMAAPGDDPRNPRNWPKTDF